MLRKISITIFLAGCGFASAAWGTPPCDRMLSIPPLVRDRKIIPAFWTNAPLLSPRFDLPSYRDPRFDVRIFSDHAPLFSPRRLQAAAVFRANELLTRFSVIQFAPSKYIHFLIAAQKEAIHIHTGYDECNQAVYKVLPPRCPRVCGRYGHFLVSDGIGLRRLNVRSLDRADYNDGSYMLWPVRNDDYHWLSGDSFVMAHEIAHLTESPYPGQIWNEARADFLAFVVTEIPRLTVEDGLGVYFLNRKGELIRKIRNVLRDLIRPRIANVTDALPFHRAFHENSEVISSRLYRWAQEKGVETVLDFIKTIDEMPEQQNRSADLNEGDAVRAELELGINRFPPEYRKSVQGAAQ